MRPTRLGPLLRPPRIVQVPTWFWIDDPWEPITASASEGTVAVTVSATPLYVDWDTGDGTTERCDGPGVAWADGLSEEATDCSHTYVHSTVDGLYQASSTVYWEFTWTLNGADQGVFGDFEAVTPFEYQVGEIQALET